MGSLTESSEGQVTLVIDGAGVADTTYDSPSYVDPAVEIDAVFCVLDRVSAPESVTARIRDTRALDGMQDAEWDVYRATWTYHPDDGLNVIITEN